MATAELFPETAARVEAWASDPEVSLAAPDRRDDGRADDEEDHREEVDRERSIAVNGERRVDADVHGVGAAVSWCAAEESNLQPTD